MKFEVEAEEWNEAKEEWEKHSKTLNMPEELKGGVGDKASEKLNAQIDIDRKPNSSRNAEQDFEAKTTINSSQFKEVKQYLLEAMIGKYNRGDEVDIEELTEKSKNKVAAHYFDQLNPFGIQQKKS